MGALLGLGLGLGLLLVWRSGPRAPVRRTADRSSVTRRIEELLVQAGLGSLRPVHLIGACAAVALVVFVIAAAVSGSPVIGVAFAAFGAGAPVTAVRHRRRRR